MNISKSTSGNRRTLRLEGRFDFSTHRDFREAVKEAVATGGIAEIMVDMRKVDYIDSSALGMLLLSRENAQAAGKTILLASAAGTVRDVLRIANFEKLFAIE